MTAEQAIQQSIETSSVVHLHNASSADLDTLRAECDECAEMVGMGGDTNDYWGTDDDGAEWRVICD